MSKRQSASLTDLLPRPPSMMVDAGALIALERHDGTVEEIVRTAKTAGTVLSVPTVVMAEWWRDDSGKQTALLREFGIEHVELTEELAKRAGKALGAARKKPAAGLEPSAVDAIVIVTAAYKRAVVLTGDIDDFQYLKDRNRSLLGHISLRSISATKRG